MIQKLHENDLTILEIIRHLAKRSQKPHRALLRPFLGSVGQPTRPASSD
jgi:hypothetical protein